MINPLLDNLYHLNIELKIKNNNLNLVYKEKTLSTSLKEQIKENKQKIVTRLKENDMAINKGFSVYNHGMFYEYRYGYGSYIFIERHSNGLVTAWRANYRKDSIEPYKIKIITKNKEFNKAFNSAAGFIDWLKKVS